MVIGLVGAWIVVPESRNPSGGPPDLLGALLATAGMTAVVYAIVANPAIIEAVMSAIPSSAAGAGAGIDGTMSEVGGALGVAVLGTVTHERFVALLPVVAASFPAAMATAGTEPERRAVTAAFAAGLETGQLVGAAAVLAGGLLSAYLLHRSRYDHGDPGRAWKLS